jgi:uncharacterized protein (DUF1330 family)
MPVEPDQQQMQEIAALASADDGPRVMLNLNRYRDREAYLRYAAVAERVLERVGGHVLWHTSAGPTFVGEDANRFDEVIAVWYPNVAAFVTLATDAEILAARPDRLEGLESAAVICCDSGAEPVLEVAGI